MTEDRQFFDDDGRRAPAVGFSYPEAGGDAITIEEHEAEVRRAQRETVARLIAHLAEMEDRGIVQFVRLCDAVITKEKLQRELAQELGVTQGRVSQLLISFRRKFREICEK